MCILKTVIKLENLGADTLILSGTKMIASASMKLQQLTRKALAAGSEIETDKCKTGYSLVPGDRAAQKAETTAIARVLSAGRVLCADSPTSSIFLLSAGRRPAASSSPPSHKTSKPPAAPPS
jgi:hypothetical protein